jgi:predicted RNA-binding protein with TRAM domain
LKTPYFSEVRCRITPRKRAPRNAKNKRNRGFTCPVEIGKTYEVDIIDLSPNGEGLANLKGFSIFVSDAKVGEHLNVKIIRTDSLSADAEKVM